METIDYQSYTVEELRLIAPYDPEAEAELRRREEASPDAAPPESAPAAEPTAPPEPGDAAAAYAETMALLHAAQQHELNRRWREESDPYAGLAYAAKLLRESDSVSERTAAMDMLLQLEVVFMEQLSEQTAAPRLALRDVQLALAGGYRSGVRATGESDALPELAFRRYENAYELDPGCVGTLAWCWQTGYGTRKDPKRAAQLLEAAHDGSAVSWKRLGDAYALLGWNAKAEECRAAAQQQEKRRRRSLRQRVSKRTLRIIAGVLAATIAMTLLYYAVIRSPASKSQAQEAAVTETENQESMFEDITYYGIIEEKTGRDYYCELELFQEEEEGVPALLTLYQLDPRRTIYGIYSGYLTDIEDSAANLNLEEVNGDARYSLHLEGQSWSWVNEYEYDLDVSCDEEWFYDAYLCSSLSIIGERQTFAQDKIDLLNEQEHDISCSEYLSMIHNTSPVLNSENLFNGIYITDAAPAVSEAEATFALNGAYTKFHFEPTALSNRGGRSIGWFAVFLDGRLVTSESGEIVEDDEFHQGYAIDVTGVQELKIVLYSPDGGVNGNGDQALINLFVFK